MHKDSALFSAWILTWLPVSVALPLPDLFVILWIVSLWALYFRCSFAPCAYDGRFLLVVPIWPRNAPYTFSWHVLRIYWAVPVNGPQFLLNCLGVRWGANMFALLYKDCSLVLSFFSFKKLSRTVRSIPGVYAAWEKNVLLKCSVCSAFKSRARR